MILLFISNRFELLSTCYNMNEQTYYIRKASFEKVSQPSAIDIELVKIGPYFLKSLCTHCFLVWTLIRYQIFGKNLWSKYRDSNFFFTGNMATLGIFPKRNPLYKWQTLFFGSWSGEILPQIKTLLLTCQFCKPILYRARQLWSKTFRSNVSSGNENRPCWMYQV